MHCQRPGTKRCGDTPWEILCRCLHCSELTVRATVDICGLSMFQHFPQILNQFGDLTRSLSMFLQPFLKSFALERIVLLGDEHCHWCWALPKSHWLMEAHIDGHTDFRHTLSVHFNLFHCYLAWHVLAPQLLTHFLGAINRASVFWQRGWQHER